VRLVEVDVIGLEPAKTLLGRLKDMFSREAELVATGARREEDFRGHNHGVSVLSGSQPGSEHRFGGSFVIGARGVEEVSARINELIRHVVSSPFVDSPTESLRPHCELRDVETAFPEISVAHGRSLSPVDLHFGNSFVPRPRHVKRTHASRDRVSFRSNTRRQVVREQPGSALESSVHANAAANASGNAAATSVWVPPADSSTRFARISRLQIELERSPCALRAPDLAVRGIGPQPGNLSIPWRQATPRQLSRKKLEKQLWPARGYRSRDPPAFIPLPAPEGRSL
jgi:hypothetical protein